MSQRGLMLILDGVGDRPVARLDGMTPLESARTPTLDALATRGCCGLMDPLRPSVAVETHTGTALLLGLSVADALRLSRGPVEAAGSGAELRPGDLALRCNFASLERRTEGLYVVDRRAGRISEGTAELAAALAGIDLGQGLCAELFPATGHRAVLRLRGPGLSDRISNTDPMAENRPLLLSEPLNPRDASASYSAGVLNTWIGEAHRRLQAHPLNRRRARDGLPPANGVVTRGAGMLHRLDNLLDRIELPAAVVAGERTVVGLGRLFGFEVVCHENFTAMEDTDLRGKLEAATELLHHRRLVFVHVKATDILSHDRQPLGKRDFLERVDAELGRLELTDVVVAVVGDHSTSSTTGEHVGDPVPVLLASPGGRSDGCEGYGERQVCGGGLGRIDARGLLLSMLDQMDVLPHFRPGDDELLSPPERI
jgi:2,3-bisphosphoglycerate-independent phosphoglycerate mutase